MFFESIEFVIEPFCKSFSVIFSFFERVDFELANGRPLFYEINTNPKVGGVSEHPSQSRVKSMEAFVKNYSAAIKSIDVTAKKSTGIVV